MTTTSSFGQWMKQRRKLQGLSQEQMAEIVACSIETIRKIEADVRRPSIDIARRLADALEIPPSERQAFLQRARPDLASAGQDDAGEERARHGLAGIGEQQRELLALSAGTALIGRDAEILRACALLRQPDTRLLTLTGPGGTGKTRMGLAILSSLRGEFADGAAAVLLASISDPQLVILTIAHALGLKEQRHLPIERYLQDSLQDKELLLLLDNFEQVLPAVQDVAALLRAAPRLKLIVTSRSLLNLSIEQEFQVWPLDLPSGQPMPPASQLQHYPAVALFIQRMRLTGYQAALSDAEIVAIATICARLDGVPLAIELAAARTRMLSPQDLLSMIMGPQPDRAIDLLSGGPHDLPPRQQTMRTTIDWSYQLLDPAQQALLRQLALFVGGWTIEAATAIIGDAQPPAPDAAKTPAAAAASASFSTPLRMLDGLTSLLNQSLIRREEQPAGMRFSMLETIREYALERLEASAEGPDLRERHMRYYRQLVQTAEPALRGPQQELWLPRLMAEYDNIRAALLWLLEQERSEEALAFMVSFWLFWQIQGYNSEARRWFERALAQHALQHPGAGSSARARAFWALGWLTFDHSGHRLSKGYFEESLAIARAIDDQATIGLALHGTGKMAEIEGEYDRAIADYQESLAIARALDNLLEIAWSLDHLGVLLRMVGHTAEARGYFEESLQSFRLLHDRHALIWSLIHLGSLLGDQGEYQRGVTLLEECLGLAQEQENPAVIAWASYTLGYVISQQGFYTRADQLFSQSLALFSQSDNKRGVMLVYFDQGLAAYLQGDLARSRQLFDQSMGLAQLLGDQQQIARARIALGRIALDQGRPEAAQPHIRGGLELLRAAMRHQRAEGDFYQDHQVVQAIVEGLAELAGVCARQGRAEPAITLLGFVEAFGSRSNALLHARCAGLLEQLRPALEQPAFEAAWQRGQTLLLGRVLELALSIAHGVAG